MNSNGSKIVSLRNSNKSNCKIKDELEKDQVGNDKSQSSEADETTIEHTSKKRT
jgi:hypothetical protein